MTNLIEKCEAHEIQLKYNKKLKASDFPKITCSNDAADYVKQIMGDNINMFEEMFILILNRANRVIGWYRLGKGGVSGVTADIKIMLKLLCTNLGSAAILAHNHPSGQLKPSQPDMDLTRKAKEAMRLVDAVLLDHVICTEESYLSFADEGLL